MQHFPQLPVNKHLKTESILKDGNEPDGGAVKRGMSALVLKL